MKSTVDAAAWRRHASFIDRMERFALYPRSTEYGIRASRTYLVATGIVRVYLASASALAYPLLFALCSSLFPSVPLRRLLIMILPAALLALSLVAAHSDQRQEPIAGPLKDIWYNALPGDGGTQVFFFFFFFFPSSV